MRHLNYTHLLYFWTVAREGSIARASEVLHLTQQTISGQLKKLEDSVGEALFAKSGRGLTLTDTGQVVSQYADEIFYLGAELTQRVRSKQALIPTILNVGVVNSVPKLVAQRILSPALTLEDPVRINCKEGDQDLLLADLFSASAFLSGSALPDHSNANTATPAHFCKEQRERLGCRCP